MSIQMGVGGYCKPIVEKTFGYIFSNDLRQLKKQLETGDYCDLNKYLDDYDNTLLHIAVLYGRNSIVEYLMSKGMSDTKTNKFGDSPFTIMMKNHNKGMIDLVINSKLAVKETKCIRLEDDLLKSQLKCDRLVYENSELTRSNKRLRDDNEVLDRDNKKLKQDVQTYIDMFKKK